MTPLSSLIASSAIDFRPILPDEDDAAIRAHWARMRDKVEAEGDRRGSAWLDGADAAIGIPRRMWPYRILTFPDRASTLYRAVVDWMRSRQPDEGLFVVGPAGVGKTGLLTAVVRELAIEYAERHEFRPAAEDVAAWTTESMLLQNLRPDGKPGYYDRVRNVEFLMIDDIGTASLTDWGYEQVFSLLDHRYVWGLPTLMTTNLAVSDFDDRLIRRIDETSRVVVIEGRERRVRVTR